VSLPTPPDDSDVYRWLGPQRRWVLLVMNASFAIASISLLRFSTHQWERVALLFVLLINAVAAGVSLLSGQNTRRVSAQSHGLLIQAWRADDAPSVDVLLPTAGEPIDVLRNTYAYVAQLSWPGRLEVLVLDDAARPEVELAARAHGFRYLSRPDRGVMRKAGNLAHGFANTDGALVAIFDADFCPRPDYLLHLVPYFGDAAVGIVQSPQVFETSTRMGWLERSAGATQELFYRWVQPSRDGAGAPICVGTCAVYRRSALVEAGGFAQIQHSEDVHTGVRLMGAGYRTQYVPLQLARGVCPDDLAGFINQQYRWCTGSLTLLANPEFHRLPLTVRQRACFWSGFLYYLSTAVNVFAIHVPGLVVAWTAAPEVRARHYLLLVPTMWVWLVFLPAVFTGRWRYPVLRVQMAYSFAHAVAIVDMLRGHSAGWVATGAVGRRGSRLARVVSLVMVTWLTAFLALFTVAVTRDIRLYGIREFWPMALFLVGYAYLAVPLVTDAVGVLVRRSRPAAAAAPAVVTEPEVVVSMAGPFVPRQQHPALQHFSAMRVVDVTVADAAAVQAP
jgi:cellulose synthase (UDP-forming)